MINEYTISHVEHKACEKRPKESPTKVICGFGLVSFYDLWNSRCVEYKLREVANAFDCAWMHGCLRGVCESLKREQIRGTREEYTAQETTRGNFGDIFPTKRFDIASETYTR